MQKSLNSLTPLKNTVSKLSFHDQHLLKELSPQIQRIWPSGFGKITLQMLHSPIPTHKDLFSQLIQSQLQVSYGFQNYQILQEDSYQLLDELNVKESTQQMEPEVNQDNEQEEDESQMKKRKRKSSSQIKILKQELQNEPNWSKQKIAGMSQATGLSQSQVYKWWWDQKKKSSKHEKENPARFLGKKKLIRKDFSKRLSQTQQSMEIFSDYDLDEAFTKPKIVVEIEEVPETQKKINKRLTFL